MDQPKSSLTASNEYQYTSLHSQQEMIQYISVLEQLSEEQKDYMMACLFGENEQPLEMHWVAKLTEDEFCLNWLETRTQFDYERFKATMQSLEVADQELRKGATSAIQPEEDWKSEEVQRRLREEQREKIEYYRKVHEDEIKQNQNVVDSPE
jgi:hypothetical protein